MENGFARTVDHSRKKLNGSSVRCEFMRPMSSYRAKQCVRENKFNNKLEINVFFLRLVFHWGLWLTSLDLIYNVSLCFFFDCTCILIIQIKSQFE